MDGYFAFDAAQKAVVVTAAGAAAKLAGVACCFTEQGCAAPEQCEIILTAEHPTKGKSSSTLPKCVNGLLHTTLRRKLDSFDTFVAVWGNADCTSNPRPGGCPPTLKEYAPQGIIEDSVCKNLVQPLDCETLVFLFL